MLNLNSTSRLSFIFVISAAVLFAACKSDYGVSENGAENTTSFTSADADSAIEAFNRCFYNSESHLYYKTSSGKEIGAIWTQAIFWDINMDAYLRTGNEKYRNIIDEIYLGGAREYDSYNWNNTVEWFIYDDIMWWVIAFARAHEITGNRKYLDYSMSGFNRVWEGSHDPEKGGMWWNFSHGGKNACINYPTIIAAMRLYNITGGEHYLEKAKEIYDWSHDNLFDSETGRVADHQNRDGNIGWEDYTYNQGTCIGAAVMLYKETGEQQYLEDAKMAADYTRDSMCNSDGILPAEGDWNEQGVLKAIFSRYMMMLILDCEQDQYLSWMQHNANTAWANRDKSRNITYRDYTVKCSSGTIQSYEASSAVGLMQVCPPPQN